MIARRVRLLACFAVTGLGAIVACSSVDAPPPFPEGELTRDGGATTRVDGSVAPGQPPPPAPDGSTKPHVIVTCPQQTTVGEPLTCAWLQSTKNCWAAALAVVESCPERGGQISADDLSCSSSTSGSNVTFDPPAVTSPVAPDRALGYTLTGGDGGQRCYSLGVRTPPATGEGEMDVAITTAAGCMSAIASGAGLTILCPDGLTHTANINDISIDCRPPFENFTTDTSIALSLYWGSNTLGKTPGSFVFALDCHF